MDGTTNGRRIRPGDPLADRINAKSAMHKAAGESYPSERVADYSDHPHVWYGRIPYREDDLVMLRPARNMRYVPVTLPEGYTFDGDSRIPGETKQQHGKYIAYRNLGPARSFTKLAKALGYTTKSIDGLTPLAKRFYWEDRCRVWDAETEREAQQAVIKLHEDQIRDHLERRQLYLDNEHEIVATSIKRIKQMLAFPIDGQRIVMERDAEGREVAVTIIEPAKWNYASLSQFIGELQKLARLHFGLSTSNASQKIEAMLDGSAQQQNRTPLSPEEQAAHDYASLKAEQAYFAALEEFKQRHTEPERLTAQIAAD